MMHAGSGITTFDVVVVGGGPSGATVANDLAKAGRSVMLLDRAGRIKPCGGAVPPRLIRDFDIPAELIVARVTSARMIAPSNIGVDMPIENGYVGMVDRETFDEFLRERAQRSGAQRVTGTFDSIGRDPDGVSRLVYRSEGELRTVRARYIVGADGANSAVQRATLPKSERVPFVFAYHEIVRAPATNTPTFDHKRCDVIYQGSASPDFYGWIFPHGETMSIGTGTANKGFSLKGSVAQMRKEAGLDGYETIRSEGAPIPLRPLKRWDNGRDVLLIGDAAGVVAPASGEGIYYAMFSARLAAEAVELALATGSAKALKTARKRFMKAHGRIFWVLGLLQYFWYRNDKRREQFVKLCKNPDVQKLTWESYMNKELVRNKPMAHVRVFFNDLVHLLGLKRA
jgi:geranylgeranyl diphosphate/geranylgeranyl-bacteriochlorophyllide a reductase